MSRIIKIIYLNELKSIKKNVVNYRVSERKTSLIFFFSLCVKLLTNFKIKKSKNKSISSKVKNWLLFLWAVSKSPYFFKEQKSFIKPLYKYYTVLASRLI